MKKKLLAILLSFCMIFTAGTISAFAADEQDQPAQIYYQFVDRILDGYNFDAVTDLLSKYVEKLNKAIQGDSDLVKNARHLIEDYIADRDLDDTSKKFLNETQSVIAVIVTDPDVNSNALKLVEQTKEFVSYVQANSENLENTAVKNEIQTRIDAIAGTINTALKAVEPYVNPESKATYGKTQETLSNATATLRDSKASVAEKVSALVSLATDKGVQKIVSNTVKTVVKQVVDQTRQRVVNILNSFFRR